jgi:hypothetical protein
LTSWFVVRSMALHRAASADPNWAATPRHLARLPPAKTSFSAGTAPLSATRYSTSTRTRYLINAASLK